MARSPVYNESAGAPIARLQWSLWGQWTLANTVGEAIGLSATLLAGILLFTQLEPIIGPLAVAVLGAMLGAGIEGGVVGTAQWLVLRRPLGALRWRIWFAATAIGAGIAWALLLVPSTIASFGTTAADNPSMAVQDFGAPQFYGLAAGGGFIAGAILAVAQWWVLRRFVPFASLWILANAVAWAPGMALVFLGVSFVPASGVTVDVIALLIAFVVLTGAVVGATHGLALIWLLRRRTATR